MGLELREMDIVDVKREFQTQRSISKERGAEVVESIKRHGVLHPPRIDAKGQLVLGDVQLWGARAAGETKIGVLVEDREITELDALRLSLSEDVQTIGLKISEKAQRFKRLMELEQCSASEAAASVGTSNATVSRLFAIAALEEPFRELADSGRLGVKKAYELSLMKPEERLALLPAIEKGELSREDLHAARKSGSGVARKPGSGSSKRVKVVLDGNRTVIVQGAELDMDAYIDAIGTLLREAKKAQARGVLLQDFARDVRGKKTASA